ncbi:hypothetical protein DFH29DRAFT_995533 [Suillus ampliporus]|nr:hypothetical protein DFH29DRAFT_995533 [Suillus ampliporus]
MSTTVTPEKRQVVVVLGGDHPLGLPLIIELEQKRYIVITSVSTLEAVSSIESKGHGYVRALILDPSRSHLLCPDVSQSQLLVTHMQPLLIIPFFTPSFLYSQLPIPSIHTAPTPIEQLSLRSTYLPHLLSTHFAPLQALLPLLRADAQRARDRKSIVAYLPAADARFGLPFGGVAVAQGMSSIHIVAVDVDVVGETPVSDLANPRAMVDWTPSEKATYGPASTALGETSMGQSRRPEDISVLINSIVGVVSAGTKATTASKTICGIRVGVGYERIRDWIRGDRSAVSAGGTHTFASFLPSTLLDGSLSLLVGVRNWLLPAHGPKTPLTASRSPLAPRPSASEATEPLSEPEDISGRETGSEADLESNSGDGDASAVESLAMVDRFAYCGNAIIDA